MGRNLSILGKNRFSLGKIRKGIIILIVLSLLIILFISGCMTNTLPTTTINMDVKSMEEVCRGNGYLVEKIEDGGETIVNCVFKDGSSCDAKDFYRGTCYPVNKQYSKVLQLKITKPIIDASSLSLVIGYNNEKIIPMIQNPLDSQSDYYSISNQVMFKEKIFIPEGSIIGSSATRETILFALNTKIPIVLSGNIADIKVQSVSSLKSTDIWIISAIVSHSDGTQKDIKEYIGLEVI